MEYYEGYIHSTKVKLLPLCKECKTLYKYYDKYEERTRYLKKDINGLIVVQAENEEIAKKILFSKQKEILNNAVENIQKCIEWELENNKDIIGISTSSRIYFIDRYFNRIFMSNDNQFHDYDKLPFVGIYDNTFLNDMRTKIIENVCKKLNKSFKFNIKYKGNRYAIEIPLAESIKLGEHRDELVLYEQFSFHINDHNRFSEWKENTILPIELLKLPVSYRKLLDEWVSRNKKDIIFSAVLIDYDYRFHDEERDYRYGLVDTENEKLKVINVNSVKYYKELTTAIKNSDIKIFSSSFSLYMTRDFLFQHTKLTKSNDGYLFSIEHASNSISSIIYDRSSICSNFILSEIKRQLDSYDWKAYLLLNEVNDND